LHYTVHDFFRASHAMTTEQYWHQRKCSTGTL